MFPDTDPNLKDLVTAETSETTDAPPSLRASSQGRPGHWEGGSTSKIAVKHRGKYGKIMINMFNHLGFRIYILLIYSIFLGKARWENLGEIDLQRIGGSTNKARRLSKHRMDVLPPKDAGREQNLMVNNVWYSSSWWKQASNNDEADNALFVVRSHPTRGLASDPGCSLLVPTYIDDLGSWTLHTYSRCFPMVKFHGMLNNIGTLHVL